MNAPRDKITWIMATFLAGDVGYWWLNLFGLVGHGPPYEGRETALVMSGALGIWALADKIAGVDQPALRKRQLSYYFIWSLLVALVLYQSGTPRAVALAVDLIGAMLLFLSARSLWRGRLVT